MIRSDVRVWLASSPLDMRKGFDTLAEAVRTVLDGGNNLSVEAFQKLRAAGIVYGQYATNAKMRCDLYARYLSRHLKEPAG